MKIIQINRTDGGISVMRILNDAPVETEIARWAQNSGLAAASWSEIQEADIPDRTYRNAWEVA